MASLENINRISEDMTLDDIAKLRPYPLYVEENVPSGSSTPFYLLVCVMGLCMQS